MLSLFNDNLKSRKSIFIIQYSICIITLVLQLFLYPKCVDYISHLFFSRYSVCVCVGAWVCVF